MSLTNEQFMKKIEEMISSVIDIPDSSPEIKTLFVQRFILTCVKDAVTYMSQKEGEEEHE